jgi:hypothetical protein
MVRAFSVMVRIAHFATPSDGGFQLLTDEWTGPMIEVILKNL